MTNTTNTTPVGEDESSPEGDQALRVVALQHASFLSSSETPLEEFLSKASEIEKFLSTGDIPQKGKEK